MAASRQHVASFGIGAPGRLLATMGLGRIAPFVPVVPDKETQLIGADPSQRVLTGSDPSLQALNSGLDPTKIEQLDCADPGLKTLDGADPSLRTLDGQEDPTC